MLDYLSVCVALIHNNNDKRNALIRPEIATLVDFLAVQRHVESFEIAYQPALQPHTVSLSLKKDLCYKVVEFQWKKYRLLTASVFANVRDTAIFIVRKYFNNRNGELDRWCRTSAIETIVTDKHIRAWDRFLESRCNVLICLEDDAIFKEDSRAATTLVLERISRLNSKHLLYVDLGGGCALSDLTIAQLVDRQEPPFTYYKKAVTNTACAYLLSRPLVEKFRSTLIKMPSLRLLSIDWMMNRLLIQLDKEGEHCDCFHLDPTVFKHGSVTGEFSAWER